MNDLDQSAVWTCKVGYAVRRNLSHGADAPMRAEVRDAFVILTGEPPDFIFSGWAGELTEAEEAVVEDREPRRDVSLRREVERLVRIYGADEVRQAIDNLP